MARARRKSADEAAALYATFEPWIDQAVKAAILPDIAFDVVRAYFEEEGGSIEELGIDPNTIPASNVVVQTGIVDDSGSMAKFAEIVPAIFNVAVNKTLQDMGKAGDPIITCTELFNRGMWHPYKDLNEVPFMTGAHYQADGGTPLYRRTRSVLRRLYAKTAQIVGAGRQPLSVTYTISDGEDADDTYHAARVTPADVAAIARPLLSRGPHILAAAALGGRAHQSFLDMGWDAQWISSDDDSETGLQRVFQRVRNVSSGASQAGGVAGMERIKSGGFN